MRLQKILLVSVALSVAIIAIARSGDAADVVGWRWGRTSAVLQDNMSAEEVEVREMREIDRQTTSNIREAPPGVQTRYVRFAGDLDDRPTLVYVELGVNVDKAKAVIESVPHTWFEDLRRRSVGKAPEGVSSRKESLPWSLAHCLREVTARKDAAMSVDKAPQRPSGNAASYYLSYDGSSVPMVLWSLSDPVDPFVAIWEAAYEAMASPKKDQQRLFNRAEAMCGEVLDWITYASAFGASSDEGPEESQ